MSGQEICEKTNKNGHHKLNDTWTLWAHLPHDVNWNVSSYKNIYTMSSIEETIALIEAHPDNLIKNCMLFVMRKGILPIWEDAKNTKGGCFSYKVNNKTIVTTWKQLIYKLVGETLLSDVGSVMKCNGITISPKRNFCIIKIWFSDCTIQNPQSISDISGLSRQGCIFKKHNPEY